MIIPLSMRTRTPGTEEVGQGLAEYALMLGLVAVAAIASLLFLGDAIGFSLSLIGSTVDSVL